MNIYQNLFKHLKFFVSICFIIGVMQINQSMAEKKTGQSKIRSATTKEIALKLQAHLKDSISISLAPKRWLEAGTIIKKAVELENEGEKLKSTESFSEAGKILLSIEKDHPFRKLSDSKIQLGEILFDKKTKIISFPATITYHEDMPVEVLLCKTKANRAYESIFVSDIRPIHLQTILYLAGYMNGSRNSDNKKVQQGARLKLSISFTPEGADKVIARPVEDFLFNDGTNSLWKHKYWIFVGSNAEKGRLTSDLTGEMIITWCVGPAIIQPSDHTIASGKTHLSVNKLKEFPDKAKVTFLIFPAN